MVAIRIRSATRHDAEAIYAIHKDSIAGLCSDSYSQAQIEAWTELRLPQDYERSIAKACVLVAEGSEGTVGFAILGMKCGELHALYVHPDCVGQRVGATLLAAVESQALHIGLSRVTLNATLNAVSFYEGQGYSSLGPNTYELPGGIELPCVRMYKTLA